MTAQELRRHFEKTFGLGVWPDTFEVDAETYGRVVNELLSTMARFNPTPERVTWLKLAVGKSGGLFFKNVELILKDK